MSMTKTKRKKLRARQAHQRQPRKAENVFVREASIERESIDAEARTAEVSFSSQAPVQDRWFGPPTVLLHEEKSVDFAAIRAVGSALMNHDPSIDSIVGRLDGIRLDAKKRVGRATIHFDDDDIGNRAFAKVQSGSLRGVSVRFEIERAQILREKDEWESPEGQKFRGGTAGLEVVTRWAPREISLTPIPADVSVGVGREQERETSPMFSEATLARLKKHGLEADAFGSEEAAIAVLDKLDAAEKRSEPPAPVPVPVPPPAPQNTPPDEKEMKARVKVLHDLAKRAGDFDLASKWLDANTSTDDAYRETLGILESRNPTPAGPPLDRGHDALAKAIVQIDAGLSRRCGLEFSAPKDFGDLPDHISIQAAARLYLRAANVPNVDFLGDAEAVERAWHLRKTTGRYEAFARASAPHTTGDFPLVLANLANKMVLMGVAEAQTTFQRVATFKTLNDFRVHTFVQAGEIEDLELTPDTMQFPAATMAEKSQGMQLFTYARKIGFGRQALINDDIGALTDMSRRLGQASARTRNKVFWDHIVSSAGIGPVMAEDSIALFATTHPSGANYLVGSGTTLQTSQLAVGRKLLRLQKALTASKLGGNVTPSTAKLNISARFLIVPAALEQAADELVNGIYFPTTAATATTMFVRTLDVVVESLLDDATNGTTAWYLFASPTLIDTIAFATRAGQAGPLFRSWQVDDGLGFWWAVIDDFGVRALEHRGVFRSKGAA
jgi:phage head maturation protease